MTKTSAAQSPVNPIILGKLGAAYGIRGWLKLFSSTESADSIFAYQPWFIQFAGQWRQIEIDSWRHHKQDLIVKLKGIDDRDAAALLTNCEIVVNSDELPILAESDYYWKDLLGCQVINLQEYEMGKVIDLMETGSNDVLVVKANLQDAFGVKERLIPFLDEQVIRKVDLTTSTIEVDWDPGF